MPSRPCWALLWPWFPRRLVQPPQDFLMFAAIVLALCGLGALLRHLEPCRSRRGSAVVNVSSAASVPALELRGPAPGLAGSDAAWLSRVSVQLQTGQMAGLLGPAGQTIRC
jgi:hypothetical protein